MHFEMTVILENGVEDPAGTSECYAIGTNYDFFDKEAIGMTGLDELVVSLAHDDPKTFVYREPKELIKALQACKKLVKKMIREEDDSLDSDLEEVGYDLDGLIISLKEAEKLKVKACLAVG